MKKGKILLKFMRNGKFDSDKNCATEFWKNFWVLSEKLAKYRWRLENIYKFIETNHGTGASANKGLAIAGGKSPVHVLCFD